MNYDVKEAYNPNTLVAYFNPFFPDANNEYPSWDKENPPCGLWNAADVTAGKVEVKTIDEYIALFTNKYIAVKPTLEPYWDFFTYQPTGTWNIETPAKSATGQNLWSANDDVIVLPLVRFL